MDDIKRILVVSRMTKYCRKAVHYGVSLARKYGAELYVIHVIHNPFGYEAWTLPIYSLKEDYEKIQRKAKEDLDRIIASEKAEGLVVNELVRRGEPTEEILKVVEDEGIDLMIMLAHEEWRLEHFLFCGATEAIIRRMPCSIMLVKEELSALPD